MSQKISSEKQLTWFNNKNTFVKKVTSTILTAVVLLGGVVIGINFDKNTVITEAQATTNCTATSPCTIMDTYLAFTPRRENMSFETGKKANIRIDALLSQIPGFTQGSNASCNFSYKKVGGTTWNQITPNPTITNGMCSYTFPIALQTEPYYVFRIELTDNTGKKWIDDSITLVLKVGAFGQIVVEAK